MSQNNKIRPPNPSAAPQVHVHLTANQLQQYLMANPNALANAQTAQSVSPQSLTTPAQRASILQQLEKRGYPSNLAANLEQKAFHEALTQPGIAYIDAVTRQITPFERMMRSPGGMAALQNLGQMSTQTSGFGAMGGNSSSNAAAHQAEQIQKLYGALAASAAAEGTASQQMKNPMPHSATPVRPTSASPARPATGNIGHDAGSFSFNPQILSVLANNPAAFAQLMQAQPSANPAFQQIPNLAGTRSSPKIALQPPNASVRPPVPKPLPLQHPPQMGAIPKSIQLSEGDQRAVREKMKVFKEGKKDVMLMQTIVIFEQALNKVDEAKKLRSLELAMQSQVKALDRNEFLFHPTQLDKLFLVIDGAINRGAKEFQALRIESARQKSGGVVTQGQPGQTLAANGGQNPGLMQPGIPRSSAVPASNIPSREEVSSPPISISDSPVPIPSTFEEMIPSTTISSSTAVPEIATPASQPALDSAFDEYPKTMEGWREFVSEFEQSVGDDDSMKEEDLEYRWEGKREEMQDSDDDE